MYSRWLKSQFFLSVFAGLASVPAAAGAEQCMHSDLDVVVLGSGGPELSDRRASTGYLVREKGKARFIVDFGAGSSLNFEYAGGKIKDLEALLFTHFHVDHSNDLPALVKASYFSERDRDLPIYGPTGNHTIPTTPVFVERHFGEKGVYPYLSDFLTGEAAFRLKPVAVNADKSRPEMFETKIGGFTLRAVPVEHGLLPSLGWRIEKNGCSVTVSGDTSNLGRTLDRLAVNTDIFIAHNAVPENARDKVALKLHMTPSEIGRIAKETSSRSVVLSHFMRRTEHVRDETAAAIRRHYQGKLAFAEDCDIYSLQTGMKTGSCKQR